MKKIIFTIILCIISIVSFSQNKDLIDRAFNVILNKENIDSSEIDINKFPIFIKDIVSGNNYVDGAYSICRISTLSSPQYYLIVIINNGNYNFIDMDRMPNKDIMKQVIDSFEQSNISKNEVLLYLKQIVKLIDIKDHDTVRM